MRWDEVIDRIPVDRITTYLEIGVWKGDTFLRVLDARPLCYGIAIDPWKAAILGSSYALSGSQQAMLPQSHYDRIHERFMQDVKRYSDRARVHRLSSTVAAECEQVPLNADVIFIDGEHSYAAVSEDIDAWFPHVKPGGWIGGHDYDHPRFPGVRQAVDERYGLLELGADRTWWKR